MSLLTRNSDTIEHSGNIKQQWEQLKTTLSSFGHCLLNFHKFNKLAHDHSCLVNAAMIYQNTSDGILITDKDHQIVGINQSFTQITGYKPNEIMGKNPRFLQSGKHNKQFYIHLWETILETGKWQGKIWNKRKNGEIYPELLTINTVRNNSGHITHHMGIFTDLSKLEIKNQRIEHLAYHDDLTGLPNRVKFKERLNSELAYASKTDRALALLFIDLDNFKNVNDIYGHNFGDTILSMASNRLNNIKRNTDFLARVGGDEFVLIINQLSNKDIIPVIAQKIINAVKDPFYVDEHEVRIGVSIGISIYPHYGNSPETLLKQADQAMYEAKKSGKNKYTFYNPDNV